MMFPPATPGQRWALTVLSVLVGAGLLAWAVAVFTDAPTWPRQWPLLATFLVVGACLCLVGRLTARPADPGRADDRHHLEAELSDTRRRLDEARQEAEDLRETGRMKDAFMATVAHELRTPLSAMLGWAQVLRDENVDEATSTRALDAILRNARQQTRLISDLMDLSRIVAGTMRMEVQVVEPVAIIRTALETVRPAADAKQVTLTSTVDAEAGPVAADPARLQQVLWNLLSNSVKFTPAGGAVAVRTRAADGHVEVTVEDTGPGIPPAFLPHVFEQFRQAGGVATPSKGGLGLGLAIARRVVELHDGTITAANRDPGPGAVFTVRLPIKALRPGEARPSPAAHNDSGQPAGRLPSLTGVVVGIMDADDAREMAATVLQRHGARVLPMCSADEVLELLAREPPDVLLLDLDLADGGDDSLIRRVRDLPADGGGTTPAVALAAFASSDRTRALLSGFQLQLAKPLRPAELVAAVASLAGRTRQRVDAQEASA